MRNDILVEEFLKYPNKWSNIYNKDIKTISKMIQDDHIDILIDLAGHTSGNRIGVFAIRSAPIQISYLGYPNTTGLPNMDYFIGDCTTISKQSQQKFTETVIRIPDCFLCYSPQNRAKIFDKNPPCTSNNYATFGALCNLAKISPDVIYTWICILQQVKNSKFIIECKSFASESVRTRFYQHFIRQNIDTDRIQLLSQCYRNEFFRSVDIVLDIWPFCEPTTICEALHMGVPVISMSGNTHCHNIGKYTNFCTRLRLIFFKR